MKLSEKKYAIDCFGHMLTFFKREVPYAEKILLQGLSASFLCALTAADSRGVIAAILVLNYYCYVVKPKQDQLVNEYEHYLTNNDMHSNAERVLEILNEVSTGDPKAYASLCEENQRAMRNAAKIQFHF